MNNPDKITKLAENDDYDINYAVGKYGDKGIVVNTKINLDNRARLAAAFSEKWAMVAVEPDGEDSAGRQKVRRLTPEELAKHACDTVTALYSQFAQRKWTLHIPSYEDITKPQTPESETE
jgi:hypothetical protein